MVCQCFPQPHRRTYQEPSRPHCSPAHCRSVWLQTPSKTLLSLFVCLFIYLLSYLFVCGDMHVPMSGAFVCSGQRSGMVSQCNLHYFFETGSLNGTWSLLVQIGCLSVCSFYPSTLCRHKKDHFPQIWRLNFVSKLFHQLELSVSWGYCYFKTGVHALLIWRYILARNHLQKSWMGLRRYLRVI